MNTILFCWLGQYSTIQLFQNYLQFINVLCLFCVLESFDICYNKNELINWYTLKSVLRQRCATKSINKVESSYFSYINSYSCWLLKNKTLGSIYWIPYIIQKSFCMQSLMFDNAMMLSNVLSVYVKIYAWNIE